MLHAAELKCRDEQEIEFAEGVGNPRIAFQPLERRCVQVEDRVAVSRDLWRVGLAVQHSKPAAVSLRGLDKKPAGAEREKIGRERLRF